ncbi:MAG: glycosyltransferase [Desulfobaccales bacterium]
MGKVPGDKESGFIFSIIIPTYNRSAILQKCLQALARQDFPLNFCEVFVCDDGSTDDTRRVVEEFQAPFPLRYLYQQNRGPAAARNAAIRKATGQYLLFLNDDTILGPQTLKRHFEVLTSHPEKKIAVLGSFSFPPDYTRTPFEVLLDSSDVLFAFCYLVPGHTYDHRFFYTCNLSIPREAVVTAGLFDEDFPKPAAEDLELGCRLQKLGYKIYYDPSCEAYHDHHITLNDFYRIHKTRGQGALYLCRKQPQLREYADLANKVDYDNLKLIINKMKIKNRFKSKLIDKIMEINNRQLTDENSVKKAAEEMYPYLKELQVIAVWDGIISSPSIEIITNETSMIESKASYLPLISVIIPTYNKGNYLKYTLDSLINQSYNKLEIIVVDDGSTDDTAQIVQQYLPKINYFYKENDGYQGPGGAINFGLRQAQGDLVHCLDADDEILPHLYFNVISEFMDNSKLGAVASQAFLINEAGETQGLFKLGNFYDPEDFPLEALDHNPLIASSVVVKRVCYEVVGGRRPEYEICDDYEFWLRLSERYHIRNLHFPLIKYRRHKGGISQHIQKTKKLDRKIVMEYLSRNPLEFFFPELRLSDTPEKRSAALLSIGQILFKRGYLEESLLYMRQALEYNYNSSTAHNNVGVVYFHLGYEKKAEEHLQRALALDPGNLEAWNNLSRLRPDRFSRNSGNCHSFTQAIRGLTDFRTQPLGAAPTPQGTGRPVRRNCKSRKSSPLRVLLVSHNLGEEARAGTEVYCLNLGRALAAAGADVLFLSPQGSPNIHPHSPVRVREERLAGLPWFQFSGCNRDFFTHLSHPSFEAAFWEILERQQVDLVHFHHTYLTCLSLLQKALQFPLPVVLTLHDAWHVCPRLHCQSPEGTCSGAESVDKCTACLGVKLVPDTPENRAFLRNFLQKRREYVAALFSRLQVLSPSRFLRDLHQRSGVDPKTINISPLGLDELTPLTGVPLDSPPRFVFLGNLTPVKGADLAVRAFQTLAGQASLEIWGRVYDDSFLKGLVGYPHIRYRGAYRWEDLPQILAGAAAVVVPSYFENYPLVVREAFMLKTPVIASAVGGIPEIVCHGENGLLFSPGDVAALREMVVQFLCQPDLRTRLCQGIRPVKTIGQEAQELLALYQKLHSKRQFLHVSAQASHQVTSDYCLFFGPGN